MEEPLEADRFSCIRGNWKGTIKENANGKKELVSLEWAQQVKGNTSQLNGYMWKGILRQERIVFKCLISKDLLISYVTHIKKGKK